MSDDQNSSTNAQTTSDDVEGHMRVMRGDDAAKGGPGQPEGVVRFRNDTPDAEDDVEGHHLYARGDDAAKGGPGQPEGVVHLRNDTSDGSPTEG